MDMVLYTRIVLAGICSFVLSSALTPFVLKASRSFIGQGKDVLSDLEEGKVRVPHFGGLIFVLPFLLVLHFFDPSDKGKLLALTTLLYYLVGLIDDVMKIFRHASDGLPSPLKAFLQLLVGGISAYFAVRMGFITQSFLPIAGYVFFLFYAVNAVNITDGIDGLAASVSLVPLLFLFLSSSCASALILSSSLVAFLTVNGKEAKTYMGDGGAHALGAAIVMMALFEGKGLPVFFSSIVFSIELWSSALQIIAIRVFHRRLFAIAPLHHDLQKKGMKDERIVMVFFAASYFFALIGEMVCIIENRAG